MINKLKKKIFLIIFLVPFIVIFLLVTSYSMSYVAAVLDDENETLDYGAECVSKYSETIDTYLPMSTEDLVKVTNDRSESNRKVANLLYAILSSDLSVIKTDLDGNILEYSGDRSDLTALNLIIEKIELQGDNKGRVNKNLYSIVRKDEANYIVLLNTAGWHEEIERNILLSLVGLLAGGFALTLIAHYITPKITRPLEESIRKQNRFIADASHELKTPVSVINANIAVLEREIGENKWMEYIKEEGHSMTRLVNQLLNLSRLDYELSDGKPPKSIAEKFDISDALMETALPFDSIAFEKNIVLNVECTDSHIASGSRDDFKNIVSILLDNALSHAGSGGYVNVTLQEFSRHSFTGKPTDVTLTVSNSGPSIPAEDLPHIFDRFYKARNGQTSSVNNFGLGLSIAKALAEKNDFELSVTSENNQTSFMLTL